MEDLSSFENRYRSLKYVELWAADQGLEARRIEWRKRLVASLPFDSSDTLRILEIGTGTGRLSLEILKSFPNASVTSQDFSEVMLSHAREQLAGFGGRVTFVQSDLRITGWASNIEGTFDAVVTSFVTHTVASSIKAIYADLFGLVKPGGCFLSCEGFSPPGPSLEKLYNKQGLQNYRDRVKMETGTDKTLQEAEKQLCDRHRGYRAYFNDHNRKSTVGVSTLMDNLLWLKEAGFDEVDCICKRNRVALIGSFRH
ncbi:MAG: class I SAM-dependent methyltransferase [Dehalococcoidales bacterium]